MNTVKFLFLLSCIILYHKQLYSFVEYNNKIKNRFLSRQAFFLNNKKQTCNKKKKKTKISWKSMAFIRRECL